jgi:hypothetical protein
MGACHKSKAQKQRLGRGEGEEKRENRHDWSPQTGKDMVLKRDGGANNEQQPNRAL